MLSLVRKNGQQITILGFIKLSFQLQGSRVKIGVDAPVAASVVRTDLDVDGDCVNKQATLEQLYELQEVLCSVQGRLKEEIGKELKSFGM